MKIRSKSALINFVNQSNPVKYLFFWGHRKPKQGVSKTCFSQWYESSFEIDGVLYPTAEHFMMASKARLFQDTEVLKKIIASDTPNEAKKLGREVRDFDNQKWTEHRFDIVVNANIAKFSQNTSMKAFLLNTGEQIIVEASPEDRIWGIGLAADAPAAENPNHWEGLNLLGFALMEVRERLS